jgi:hypothetical protein
VETEKLSQYILAYFIFVIDLHKLQQSTPCQNKNTHFRVLPTQVIPPSFVPKTTQKK